MMTSAMRCRKLATCIPALIGVLLVSTPAAENAVVNVREQLVTLSEKMPSSTLKEFMRHLSQQSSAEQNSDRNSVARNTLRVAQAIIDTPGYHLPTAPFTYFSVPAMSSMKRLQDTYPSDGAVAAPLQIIAAQNEYEPISFVVFPFTNSEKATLRISPLVGSAGMIPAEHIDVKIVKIWYQGGTAWYSYFADYTGRSLVPELLVNDEKLIRVDTDTKDNYLRVNQPSGDRYVWISNPLGPNIPFNAEKTPVADAEHLQPFSLTAGEFKQFWVTVKIPKTAASGLYTSSLELTCDDQSVTSIPLQVRVLPFELPPPRTYYDLERPYFTLLYNAPHLDDVLNKNGGDIDHAEKKMRAIHVNMREHNILNPLMPYYKPETEDAFIRELAQYKEVGLNTDPLFGGVSAIPPYDFMTSDAVTDNVIKDQPLPEAMLRNVDAALAIIRKQLGHTRVYSPGYDEPAMRILRAERKTWHSIHEKGAMIYSTGHDGHLRYGGYNEDICNVAGFPTREKAAHWHAFGGRILNYAAPHTGPENPDFMRRMHGLQLYKAHYDGIGNYKLNAVGWNDFLGEKYNFRAFNMTYPTTNGVVDTIAWEAMREAVDDVRYATKLKQLAAAAIATGHIDKIYAGRKALQWLEMMDETTADLNYVRDEMIATIMSLLEGQEP